MIKWGIVSGAGLAATLLAGCADSGAPAARNTSTHSRSTRSTATTAPAKAPALVARPVSARSAKPAESGGLGLLGSTFSYDSTTASASCVAGVGAVTATESWTSSGRGTHRIEVAGHRKTYPTSAATGHESATFTGLDPGTYYVTFSSTDGAAAREPVTVC